MVTITRRKALGLIGGTAALAAVGGPALAMNRKIKVGALRFTSHSGSFIAYERGYFAKAGLDVEFKFFQAAQPMAVAIASGDIDYAVTAVSGGRPWARMAPELPEPTVSGLRMARVCCMSYLR